MVTVASLAFLVFEHFLTFEDEVEVIWSKPKHAWIKWAFLFIRYLALGVQLVNRVVDFCIATHAPMIPGILQRWYMSQVGVGGALMLTVEFVLMARVYALYQKRVLICIIFSVLVAIEVGSLILGILLTNPGASFDMEMYLSRNSRAYAYFGGAVILSQITVLALTMSKYRQALQVGWGREPIVMVTIRDGVLAFTILLSMTITTVVVTAWQTGSAAIANS
ncbi:hypothetical protein MD484_g382, partial [Candolleomyces efflorescens]